MTTPTTPEAPTMTSDTDTIEVDDLTLPFNFVTGADYQGGNIVRLLSAELENSYTNGAGWAGFKQWLTVGRVVRKGEHGTACMTVVTVEKDADGRGTTKPRGFKVFHFDQTVELGADDDEVQS